MLKNIITLTFLLNEDIKVNKHIKPYEKINNIYVYTKISHWKSYFNNTNTFIKMIYTTHNK